MRIHGCSFATAIHGLRLTLALISKNLFAPFALQKSDEIPLNLPSGSLACTR